MSADVIDEPELSLKEALALSKETGKPVRYRVRTINDIGLCFHTPYGYVTGINRDEKTFTVTPSPGATWKIGQEVLPIRKMLGKLMWVIDK
jgi:hypothetical protein